MPGQFLLGNGYPAPRRGGGRLSVYSALCQLLYSSTSDKESAMPRSITIEDLYRLQHIEEPQFTPDGRHIAYVRVLAAAREQRLPAYHLARRARWAACRPCSSRAGARIANRAGRRMASTLAFMRAPGRMARAAPNHKFTCYLSSHLAVRRAHLLKREMALPRRAGRRMGNGSRFFPPARRRNGPRKTKALSLKSRSRCSGTAAPDGAHATGGTASASTRASSSASPTAQGTSYLDGRSAQIYVIATQRKW